MCSCVWTYWIGNCSLESAIEWRTYLFWGPQRSMAGRGECCKPLLHCFRRWGRLHLWLSPVWHTSLQKRVGRRVDFYLICSLLSLKPKLFEVHQITEWSHLALMNDESQRGKLGLSEGPCSRAIRTSVLCGIAIWLLFIQKAWRGKLTMLKPALRLLKQRAIGRTVLRWQASRMLLQLWQNNYLSDVWLNLSN